MRESPVFVVGYRRGVTGRTALGYARWLTDAVPGHLHVVHVTDLDDFPLDPDEFDWEAEAEERLAAVRAEVDGQLTHSSMTWSYEVAHGDPGEALAEIAVRDRVSMVIVSAHIDGRTGRLHRMVARSIVQELFDRAQCPVLVVPCRDDG